MDLASLCAAFGLSAAAGLNAWLPLFAGALAQRLDLVELQLGANYGIEKRDHPG